MKRPFFAYLIPDVGDTQTTRNFPDAISCQAHAKSEARHALLRLKDADLIEVVVVENKTAVDGMSMMIGRTR